MSMTNQKGMVLAVILILMLPLTLMAVSVMQWGREQMKMSAAGSHNINALASLDSQLQDFWEQPDLRQLLEEFTDESKEKRNNTKGIFQTSRQYEMPCSRTTLVSSSNVIKHCRYIDISLNKSKQAVKQNSAVMTVELPFFQRTDSGINNDSILP